MYSFLVSTMVSFLLASSGEAQDTANNEQGSPRSSLFQIVLLVGEKAPAPLPEDIPSNVREALADISEFLPYKGYQMVSSALIRSEGKGQGLMSGPEDRTYEFKVIHSSYQYPEIRVLGFQLIDKSRSTERSLLSTSFVVERGETIVVGSSKLDGGDKALIVLFTPVR